MVGFRAEEAKKGNPMSILSIMLICAALVAALGLYLWWSERKWYREHPGANEHFDAIDIELEKNGR